MADSHESKEPEPNSKQYGAIKTQLATARAGLRAYGWILRWQIEMLWRNKVGASGTILIGAAIAGLIFGVKLQGNRAYQYSVRAVGPHRTQVIIAIVVVILGIGAHWFKRYSQSWYGRVEVMFGVVSSFAIAFSLTPQKLDLTRWASLIGAGYVIARGLNNVSAAHSEAIAAAHTMPPGTADV